MTDKESKWPVNRVEQTVAVDQEIKKEFQETQVKKKSCSFVKPKDDCIKTRQHRNKEEVQVDESVQDGRNRLDPRNFSSWKTLQRVQAWVLRFIKNCRLPREEQQRGELTPEEITEE